MFFSQLLEVKHPFSPLPTVYMGPKIQTNIQLSPEGEVNSGGYIPRREASRYISTALHRP